MPVKGETFSMSPPLPAREPKFVRENSQKTLNAQTEIGRRLRGCEKSLKTIASELGWERGTLDAYFPPNPDTRPTKLPLPALWDILESGALPAEIAALLAPDGFSFAPVPAGMDHDEFAEACAEFAARKARAHRADSPDGPALSKCEIRDLDERRAQISKP